MMPRRHQEIDIFLEVSQGVLDKYDLSRTPIDNDLAKAVIKGQMTPDEADECRRDYICDS